MSEDPRGRTTVVAWIRALVVVATLAGSSIGAHASAPPVAAIDCVTYYCATITIYGEGPGSFYVYDDQGEMGCSYSNGVKSGTCSVQYYWIGQMSSTLSVTLTYSPAANTYICLLGSCTNAGESKNVVWVLDRNESIAAGTTASLAKAQTVTIAGSGDGAGRVTSSPSGIDCRSDAGSTSGTCQKVFYFKDSLTITITATPDPGSKACPQTGPGDGCGSVGAVRSVGIGVAGSGSTSMTVGFVLGHPILTVSTSGQGSVTSNPAGISCGSSCSSYFPPDSNVTLQAAAKAGYVFQSWTGACNGYGATCNLSLASSDTSTTAVFVPAATPAPSTTPTPGSTPTPTKTPAPVATPSPGATPAPGTTAAPGTAGPGTAGPAATDAVGASPVAAASIEPNASGAAGPGGAASPEPASASSDPKAAAGGGPTSSLPAGGGPGAASAPGTGPEPLLIVVFVLGSLVLLLGGALGGVLLSRRRAPADPPAG